MKSFTPKGDFSRNVLTLMTGATIAQVIPVALTPILTRIYTPEEFGVFALYLAISSIFSVIATGRYELAIILPEKDSDAIHIAILSSVIAFFFSILLTAIIIISEAFIINVTQNLEIGKWLYLLPLSIFLNGIYQSFNYWNNRKKQYKRTALSKVMQSTGMVATQVGSGIFNIGSIGLILGSLIGQIAAITILLKSAFPERSIISNHLNLKSIALIAKRYKNFPILNTWAAVLNTASVQVPIMLLTIVYSTIITGFYSLAQRVLLTPMIIIGNSIGQVYFQEVSNIKNDTIQVKIKTLSLYKKLLIIGTPAAIIIIAGGDDIFATLFGESWRESGSYARFISMWIFFVFISSPLSHLMTVYEKHKQSIYFNILLFLSRVFTISLGFILVDKPAIVIEIYGIVGAILWGCFTVYLLNLAGIKPIETLKISIPSLIACGLAGIYNVM